MLGEKRKELEMVRMKNTRATAGMAKLIQHENPEVLDPSTVSKMRTKF